MTVSLNQLRWADISVGQALPSLHLDIALGAVVLTPAFTKDPYQGHWDVDHIRSLGHPTVFMNTMSLMGILDRFVTDWSGPATFIVRHSITMRRPTYAGRQIVATGSVVDKRMSDDPRRWGPAQLIDVAVRVASEGEELCDGHVTASLN